MNITNQNDSVSFSELIAILKANRVIFISISALVILFGVGISFILPKKYSATAQITIRPLTPALPGSSFEDQIENQTLSETYMMSLIPLLEGNLIANNVVNNSPISKEVKQYLGYINDNYEKLNGYDVPSSVIEDYLENISILRIKKTSLVKIKAETNNQVLSEKIANEHANQFIKLVSNELNIIAEKNKDSLRLRADIVKDKLKEVENELSFYIKENRILAIPGIQTGNVNYSLGINRSNQEILEIVKQDVENQSNLIKDKLYSKNKIDKGTSKTGDNFVRDNILEMASTRLVELRGEYGKNIVRYGQNNPKVSELRSAINELEKVISQNKTDNLAKLDEDIKVDSEISKQIEEYQQNIQNKTLSEIDKQMKYESIHQSYLSLKTLYDKLMLSLQEANSVVSNPGAPNVYLNEMALSTSLPISPNIPLNILLASIIGPMLGAMIALLVGFYRDCVMSVSEVANLLNLRIIGVIPHLGKDESEGLGQFWEKSGGLFAKTPTKSIERNPEITKTQINKPALNKTAFDQKMTSDLLYSDGSKTEDKTNIKGVGSSALFDFNTDDKKSQVTQMRTKRPSKSSLITMLDPHSAASEAIRNIRLQMSMTDENKMPRLIMVTSGYHGDGTSTVAANLALSAAQSGSSTLLIDGDLREPTLHELLGYDNPKEGLSTYLTAECEAEDIVVETEYPGLSFVPSGSARFNTSALLNSRRLQELIELSLAQFDTIIFDSSCIGSALDGLILSKKVEGVVFVARTGHSPRSIIKDAVRKLREAGAKVVGAIVNDVPDVTESF